MNTQPRTALMHAKEDFGDRRAAAIPRRRCLALLAGAMGPAVMGPAAMGPAACFGQEPAASLYVADDVDRAVDSGVLYLSKAQRGDGAIADRGHDVAMTSLAIMAMAAIGTQPSALTTLGRTMQSAIDFVLDDKHQTADGYFGARDGSRMYGHGITTLMLTEMLGMGASPDQNVRIHDALVKAIELILAAQSISKPEKLSGGWRYTPDSRDSDLSVSVWQLMALRSAKNDGLDVPGEAIERALDYLRFSYASPMDRNGVPRDKVSGFSYTPGTHHPSFTMTAAGLLAMQVCGQYNSPLVSGSADWLLAHPPKVNERFFYYGVYYFAQGMHQVGGKYAEKADKLVPELLLDAQRGDGAWLARGGEERNVGAVYATCLAILSLSVRYHYLPIYQR